MRKNSKRFVSVVLATAMTFSSVAVSTAITMADESVEEAVNEAEEAEEAQEVDLLAVTALGVGETAVFGDVTMKAVVALTEKPNDAPITVDGVEYASGIKSNGENNVKVGSSTGRAMAEFTTTKDTDVTVVVKLNDGKSGWLVESDAAQTISAVKITEGFVTFDEANTQALTAGGTFANKLTLKAGKYYYLVGGGTDLVLFDVIAGGAENTDATTVADGTTEATTTAADGTTEATTTAADGTTEATTAAADATTEATTAAADSTPVAAHGNEANVNEIVNNGKLGFVPEVKDAAGVVVNTDNGDASGYEISGKPGDKFYVDIVLYNNDADSAGNTLGTATFYFDYDPSVVKAVKHEDLRSALAAGESVVSYDDAGEAAVWMRASKFDNQISTKPSATNADFSALGADGTKTAAELGRIKYSAFVMGDTGTAPTVASKKATAVRLEMEVVAPGTTYLAITGPDGVVGVSAAPDTKASVSALAATVYGVATGEEPATDVTTEVTTAADATTEATTAATEATTKGSSSSDDNTTTTEAATQATTQAATQTTTAAQTTEETTTETTTKKSSSRSGGGGSSSSRKSSGSSSSKASGTSTKTAENGTPKSNTTNKGTGTSTVSKVAGPSFVAPNGTVITVPALSIGGKIYAGSAIPASLIPASGFTDTAARAWAVPSINKLAALGIVSGYSPTQYGPDNSCKRGDFIVMLVKTLGLTGTASDNFSDVEPGKYYANSIGLAKQAGIASGVGNNKFAPDNTISRQDMMVLVAKTLEFLGADISASTSALDKFADSSAVAEYAKPYASYLVSQNIVSGTGNNIEPTALMTRAQLAVLVDKLYDAIVDMAPAPVEETPVEEETDAAEKATETSEESSTEATTAETEESTTETTTETTTEA